jgi:hypothetical protein
MFRILFATGRSAQRRSLSTLRYLRPFHSTLSTRQRSSAAEKPIIYPVEIPQSSRDVAGSDSSLSLCISSTNNNTPSQANDLAEPKAKLTSPQTSRTRKPSKLGDDTAESTSPKTVKRRTSRARKKVETPIGRGEPALSELNPNVTTSNNHSEIDQSQNPSPASESITIIENRYRKTPFYSRNVRDDVSDYLRWARGGGPLGNSIGDSRRLNVVSKPLCGMASMLSLHGTQLIGIR